MPSTATFIDAMRSQPEVLAAARRSIRETLRASGLPRWSPGETVGVVAMGASSFTGEAVVAALRGAGLRGVNLLASTLRSAPADFQPADWYIVVSESGRSPEPIDAARGLTAGRRVGITNHPEAQIAEVVDVALGLGGFPDSPVYTAGFTATLLAEALLLDHVGVQAEEPALAQVGELATSVLTDYDDLAARLGELFGNARAIDVVASATSMAAGSEAALMIREGLRIPAAVFETYQYLHGPMEGMHEGDVLVVMGDDRELTVPLSVLGDGVRVVLVTTVPEERVPSVGHPNLTVVPLRSAGDVFTRAIVETLVMQLALAHAIEHKPFPLEEFLHHQDDTKLPQTA